MSCLDSYTCFIDVDFTQKFVSTTNYFGSKYFGCKWKTLDVHECNNKKFFTVIPAISSKSLWGDNSLGIPLVETFIIKKASF
jgi:hypothetical protein